ncbi:hypothetical protein L210DRAFT_3504583 [Boletus edulis BED1]|uniref:Uncharacterized protein n=1 Tax=Boletus edulis BED1 TaxID=1328754 RepID=A0AAD4GE28_BOLED|nr:hypothetical protein L210DRAFT_3504583 [Boletus edulis BED1]
MLHVPSEVTKLLLSRASASATYTEDEMGFGNVRIPSELPSDIPSTGPSLSMLLQNLSLAGPSCAMQTLPNIHVPTPPQPADQDAAMEEPDNGPMFNYGPLPEQITLRIEDWTSRWPNSMLREEARWAKAHESIDISRLQQWLWESQHSLAFSEAALWSTRIKDLDKCYKVDNHPPIPQ